MLIIAPIFFVGVTIIISMASGLMVLCCVAIYYLMLGWRHLGDEDKKDVAFRSACIVIIILAAHIYIVSTIEFLHSDNGFKYWDSGLTALQGQYCMENDHFSIYKWHEYTWDVKLLVISWVLF